MLSPRYYIFLRWVEVGNQVVTTFCKSPNKMTYALFIGGALYLSRVIHEIIALDYY